MPRPYSEEFIREIKRADSNNMGILLGKACVEANLPLIQVANILGVSKVSVYYWFRGRGMRESLRGKAQALLDILYKDKAAGILPLNDHKEAKKYAEATRHLVLDSAQ